MKCGGLKWVAYGFARRYMAEMTAEPSTRPGDFFSLIRRLFLIFGLLLAGCESTPQLAPVVDRAGEESKAAANGDNGRQADIQQPSNTYTVRKGDTFYSIAQSNGISQKDLAEWNNIQDPTAIQIGQQLLLSPPGQMARPSLYALPESVLSPPGPAEPRGAGTPPEIKPLAGNSKLKTEPKALKLPYSEQAVAQLKAYAASPQIVIAKIEVPAEKNLPPEASILPASPTSVAPLPAPPPASIAVETVPSADQIEWIWPTKGKVIEGFSEGTKGIDISGTSGQAVNASAAGKVVYSGAGLRGYGKLIIIKHNSTYLSAYAHNDKLLVKEGQTVSKGQKIAEMGSTDSSLVKLHFEIRKNGKPVDPLKHLPATSG
jgi:lipoprotein NlpD